MECPKCHKKIKFYDWSQTCKNCGVNLVYYNLEETLIADAKETEMSFARARVFAAKIKGALIGGPLQIVRLDLLAAGDDHRTPRKPDAVLAHVASDLRSKPLRALYDVHVRHNQHLRLVRTRNGLEDLREDIGLAERILRELNGIAEATLAHVS